MEGFTVGLFVGMFLMIAIAVTTGSINRETWERAAIQRGYASYCPSDGEWAWQGECK